MARCEKCGQQCLMSDAWTVRGFCPECRASQYGKVDAHAQPKLFEPAPTQMAGQTAMEGME